MAKELPYFKFIISEWNDGDITLCSLEAQGLFINLCSLYWSKECSLELSKAQRKFKKARGKVFEELINEKIIKVEGDQIVISFLDEQFKERIKNAEKNAENGKNGGRPKTQAKPTGLFLETQTEPKQKPIRREEKREEEKRKEHIQLCESVCEIFGKTYQLPDDRLPAFAQWYSTIDQQCEKILDAYSAEDAVRQVKAYIKYCQANKRKMIGTDFKVSETILSSDWVKLLTPANGTSAGIRTTESRKVYAG